MFTTSMLDRDVVIDTYMYILYRNMYILYVPKLNIKISGICKEYMCIYTFYIKNIKKKLNLLNNINLNYKYFLFIEKNVC